VDVCGLGPAPGGFLVTSGTSRAMELLGGTITAVRQHNLAWDNHLVPLDRT
jgi:hypothetical protein